MTKDPASVVKSADRVLDVFELLARWGAEMSHTDLVDALQIPKSSLTQLLKNLVQRGYVEFSAETKGYRLGDAFLRLSRQTGESRSLVAIIQPILEEITKVTQETSALNQLKGDHAEVAATVPSPQRLVSHMRRGDMAPLYATSGGKALLANLPVAMRDEYLRTVVFAAVTPKTIRSKRELQKQIATVLKTGVAYSYEEFTPGIVGVGVPILSDTGFPLGALNIAVPSVRFSKQLQQRAIEVLLAGAERARRQFLATQPQGGPRTARSR
jgi:DNA-binding IclR family transcriptional regulator